MAVEYLEVPAFLSDAISHLAASCRPSASRRAARACAFINHLVTYLIDGKRILARQEVAGSSQEILEMLLTKVSLSVDAATVTIGLMLTDRVRCSVRWHLTSDLVAAHRQLVALGDQEVDAVVRGDLEAVRKLGHELEPARKVREVAMSAVRVHMEQHGCC